MQQSRSPNSPHIVTLVMAAAIGPLAMNVFLPSLPGMARFFASDYAVVQLAVSLYLAATAYLMINTLLASPGRALAGLGVVALGLPFYAWYARRLPPVRTEDWLGSAEASRDG